MIVLSIFLLHLMSSTVPYTTVAQQIDSTHTYRILFYEIIFSRIVTYKHSVLVVLTKCMIDYLLDLQHGRSFEEFLETFFQSTSRIDPILPTAHQFLGQFQSAVISEALGFTKMLNNEIHSIIKVCYF